MNRPPPMRPGDWLVVALLVLATVAWIALLAYLVAAVWGAISE